MKIYRNILFAAGVMLLTVLCSPAEVHDVPDVFPDDGSAGQTGEVKDPYKVSARKNATSDKWETYDAYTVECIDGFVPYSQEEPELDEYGGWKVGEAVPTGYFTVRQWLGRWWFFTPAGNPFISKGVAVFSTGGSDRQKQALAEKFQNESNWAKTESARLKGLGFNSLGAWSSLGNIKNRKRIPYTVIVSPMGALNGEIKASGEEKEAYDAAGWEGYPYDFAMVFHEKFTQEYVESKMASLADYANDPYCMGIFTDNEIPWKDYALDRCLEKWPASHVNHQKAQQWLDARKGKTGATLAEATDEDRRAFIAYCFEEYLKKVTAAIDKLAPNIPYLGCRFNQWNYELKNDEMFKVAGKYMDVISINHYQKWEPDQQFCQAWTSWSGRPFVITEFYTKGEDSGLPNNTGAGWNVPTQQDRGYFYQNFVNGLLKSGNCVGWHWFTYMDNDPENMNTDPSNRDSNKGMVTWDFEPYIPLQDNMKQMNENVYWLARFYDGNPAGEN